MTEDHEYRRRAILEMAGRLLVEKGYASTSMLQIAKAAKASNETLYKWWENKQALFADLVADNAARVVDAMARADIDGLPPLEVLRRTAPVLLRMLTGPLAIALNRAAAADQADTRTLGAVLAREGRARVGAALTDLMNRAVEAGEIAPVDPHKAADLYVTQLVGDLQIRLVTGALEGFDGAAIEGRVEEAMTRFSAILRASSCSSSNQ